MYTLYHCQTTGARKENPRAGVLDPRISTSQRKSARKRDGAGEILTTRCVGSLPVCLSASLYDGFMSQYASSRSQQK
jgi:hypothetical protein